MDKSSALNRALRACAPNAPSTTAAAPSSAPIARNGFRRVSCLSSSACAAASCRSSRGKSCPYVFFCRLFPWRRLYGLEFVGEVRREPFFRFDQRHFRSPRIVLDLVAADLADREVARLRVREVEAR